MKLSKAVGERIKSLLTERNLTQYELAKQGGIPRSTLSVIISAKHETVKLDTIYQICDTLQITLKEFFNSPLFDNVED